MLDRQMRSQLHHLFVRSSEREVQEAEWIEQGLWRVPERFENDLLGHLGRLRAIGMAAHAVDDDEQRRVLGRGYRDPILVLLAPAKEADIGVLHPQEEIRASVRLGVLYITLTLLERSSRHACRGSEARSAVRAIKISETLTE